MGSIVSSIRPGSSAGEAVLAKLPVRPATAADEEAAAAVVARAARDIDGRFDSADLHDLLLRNLESPRWDEVAERCLTCGNCTLVCPTCFCTHVEDASSLDGSTAERSRVWDTCFSLQYAEMHGGNTRPTPRARYRQWLTHKLATWEDQFGSTRLRRLRPLHRLVPGRHRHPRRSPGHPRRRGTACARLTHSSSTAPSSQISNRSSWS